MSDRVDTWTYGNAKADEAPADRIERIRNGILTEMEFQFTGKAAPEMASPLYEELSRHIAQTDKHLQALAHARQSNIRLLLTAVHHLILLGSTHPLSEYFLTVGGAKSPDDELVGNFEDFVDENAAAIEQRLQERGVQTNEVRRCATLWPAFTEAYNAAGKPLALIELGCSSGLNLMFDRYGYRYSDGRTAGDPTSNLVIDCRIEGDGSPSLADEIPVAFRVGIDRDPVDLAADNEISWMRACIWPEHLGRLANFDAAIQIARLDPPKVMEGDMVDTVGPAIDEAPDDAAVCIFHTSAVNYLRRERREALVTTLQEVSVRRPILWVSGEGPGVVPGAPAPHEAWERAAVPLLLAELRDGSIDHRLLGLAGAHGAWLEWYMD